MTNLSTGSKSRSCSLRWPCHHQNHVLPDSHWRKRPDPLQLWRSRDLPVDDLSLLHQSSTLLHHQNAGESMSVLTDGLAVSPTPTLLSYHHLPLSSIQFLAPSFENRAMRVQAWPKHRLACKTCYYKGTPKFDTVYLISIEPLSPMIVPHQEE